MVEPGAAPEALYFPIRPADNPTYHVPYRLLSLRLFIIPGVNRSSAFENHMRLQGFDIRMLEVLGNKATTLTRMKYQRR